jgi:hypothetical protein
MKRKIYYVVEKELNNIDGNEEATGFKSVRMYDIVKDFDGNNQLISIGTINDVSNEDKSTEAIQEYLDDNGFGDEEFTFNLL